MSTITDNRSIIEKAAGDLAVSDLSTNGGYMQPAQAKDFIKLLIAESVIVKQGNVKPLKAPSQLIEKMRFGSRVLRAGAESTALSSGNRVKPDLTKLQLDAKLFKAEARMSSESLEDSIERGDLKDTIISMLVERAGLDMDEVVIQGDTAVVGSDPFLGSFDGMLKAATSNVVDAAGAKISKDLLRDMLKSMPNEFLRNRQYLRYYSSVDAEIDYRDSLMNRQTIGGDSQLMSSPTSYAPYSGVPLVGVPMFPENLTYNAQANTTNVILTDPKNIVIGVWRQIRVESDKLVAEGQLLVVVTLRFVFKFGHEPAVVKATNVKVA